jgi:CheY-like chemotaxis protein
LRRSAGSRAASPTTSTTCSPASCRTPLDDPARRVHLDDILEGARHASELIKQILTYSRRQPVQRRSLDLGQVVNDALRLVRASAPAQIEVVAEIARHAPPTLADNAQLHQVVMNLATNAMQAMGGSGRVNVRVAVDDLDAAAAAARPPLQPGRHLRLDVEDTGHGIDPATLPHIFEPFFTTRAGGGGTGLGLAVVRAIVESHGGAIAVDSRPGQGTTFHVWLRAHDGEAQAARPRELPRGAGQSVLVVDDEAGLAKVAAALLEKLGYRATWSVDPRAALDTLRTTARSTAAVLCDLSMPDVGGEAFAREAKKIAPELRLVLTTGYGGAVDDEAARTLGFQAVLPKPFTPEELAEIMAKVLA